MKKSILVVAGFAAIGLAAYFGGRLWAQGAGAPSLSGGTRVGVVNVGTVFVKYEKAQAFKEELQKTIAPYKTKADKWRKETIQYQDWIQKGDFSQYKKEDLEKAVKERKRAMEDMDLEVRNLIGKQQEDQLVQLWREVTSHIRAYGASKGFHIVVGYGDPPDSKDLDTFPNINRKMQGMDLGAVTPLYVAAGLDISEEVVQSLNFAYRQSKSAVGTTAPHAPGK